MNYIHNNKGFSLLEVLIALIISGILFWAIGSALNGQIKVLKRVENLQISLAQIPAAASPGADKRIYVTSQCTSLQTGNWYAKAVESRTVAFYQSSTCTNGYLGTLSALNNPTYDDTVTNTFWNVSGEGPTLRVLVRILNLPVAQ